MSLLDVAMVAVLAVFLLLLIRAAYVLGRNPHQQIREHENLAGHRFPAHVSFAERVRLINLRGLSPTNPARIWVYIAIMGIGFVVLLWLR
jgi:membrane protein implicated in regulation of membrane protease activity